MRDALDGVLQRVLEVVHRVDAPFGAGAVVRMAVDAVHRRVAHQYVRAGHVDLRAQHAGAGLEFAVLHALEQVEVLFDAAVAVGAVDAGLGQRAAVGAHLVRGLVVDIGQPAADHVLRDLIQPAKEVGRKVQLVPFVAEPFDVGLDALDERGLLLAGVGAVEEAEVALAAVLLGDAKVDAQRLCVADVQITVRLRRKARADVVEPPAGEILVDEFLDEIRGLPLSGLHRNSLPRVLIAIL